MLYRASEAFGDEPCWWWPSLYNEGHFSDYLNLLSMVPCLASSGPWVLPTACHKPTATHSSHCTKHLLQNSKERDKHTYTGFIILEPCQVHPCKQ